MSHHARRRDAVEPFIIAALRRVGASVQSLNETGCPDLLVGYRGVTLLIEVKDPIDGARNSRTDGRKTTSGMRESQEAWWRKWSGATPIVVTSVDEALVAIGVLRKVTA